MKAIEYGSATGSHGDKTIDSFCVFCWHQSRQNECKWIRLITSLEIKPHWALPPFEGFILLESFIVKSKCSLLVPFQKSIGNHLQNRFSGAIRKTGRFHTPNAMSSR